MNKGTSGYFNYRTVFFILTFLIFSLSVSAQSWQWAKYSNGNASKITTDTQGNSYVTGSFSNSFTLGSTTLVSHGFSDIYLAKYNSSGSVVWAVQAGSTLDDYGSGIGVDGLGNIYISGSFSVDYNNGSSAPCIFSGTTVPTSGATDMFLAKYDASGILIWVRSGGGIADDYGEALSVDADGNCYITGSYGYSTYNFYGGFAATFSGVQLLCNGDEDIYVAKYDSAGYLLWTEQATGSTQARSIAITNDAAGNAYITGVAFEAVLFDTTYIGSFGYSCFYVAKCNAYGWLWANGGNGTDSYGSSLTLDNFGHLFLAGDFNDEIEIGTDTLIAFSNNGSFIVKYSIGGVTENVEQMDASDFVSINSIKSDSDGSIIFTGNFADTLFFKSDTMISINPNEIFIYREDSIGNIQWSQQLGTINNNNSNDLAIDNISNIYLTGSFEDSISFGTSMLANPGLSYFVAKYGQQPVFIDECLSGLFTNVYPNPFGQSTTLSFTLGNSGNVNLTIYDLNGKQIKVLLNKYLKNGTHSFVWNGDNESGDKVENGMYFLKIQTSLGIESIKIFMTK